MRSSSSICHSEDTRNYLNKMMKNSDLSMNTCLFIYSLVLIWICFATDHVWLFQKKKLLILFYDDLISSLNPLFSATILVLTISLLINVSWFYEFLQSRNSIVLSFAIVILLKSNSFRHFTFLKVSIDTSSTSCTIPTFI